MLGMEDTAVAAKAAQNIATCLIGAIVCARVVGYLRPRWRNVQGLALRWMPVGLACAAAVIAWQAGYYGLDRILEHATGIDSPLRDFAAGTTVIGVAWMATLVVIMTGIWSAEGRDVGYMVASRSMAGVLLWAAVWWLLL